MSQNDKLVVVWTSGDKEVALKMVFMYTLNSRLKSWWDDVTLIIWGPSAKLLAEDDDLQVEIFEMRQAGVKVMACKACADQYGVSEAIEAMGIEVKYVGETFTQILKEDNRVITF
jgi:hypothetical protein